MRGLAMNLALIELGTSAKSAAHGGVFARQDALSASVQIYTNQTEQLPQRRDG